MKRSFFTRFISMILLAAVLLQTVPVAYAGVIRDENTGMISLTDANGKVVESHTEEEWAALFPTGTFAFRETELSLIEGAGEGEGKTATLTLYRLGGTTGKAEATVTLTPAVAKIEEDRFSYANAMGTKDYTVTVEDPWPIAQYQAFGGMGEIIYTGAPLTYLAADEEDYAAAEGEEITPVTLLAPEGADSYRWQMEARFFETEYYMKRWGDIENATSREFHFSEEMLDMYLDSTTYTYDFRCIYEIDGVLYCSDTLRGVQYKTGEDLPPVKPKDFVDVRERTDSKIQFDGEEYDSYSFPVTFADGEWEKEITFTVLDDDLHETVELLSVVLSDSRGAPVNKSACTVTVSIQDDEEVLPSQMGFAQSEIWVDKSAGTARIPLTRISEGLQYVTGVGYQVEDGTAIIGEDYATADTSTLFASDMDYTYIEVDLINNGLPLTKEESELYFTVKLTEPMGGTLLAGQTEIKVRLYNTAAEGNTNLATELYSAEETDLTGKVTETTALVPANTTVTATAADTGANAVATYSLYPEDGISAFTHNYGVMTFENANGGNYWTDNAMLAFDRDSVLEYNLPSAGLTDDHEKYMSNRIANWEGESGNYGSTGVYLRREKGGSMTMQVPHLYDRYTEVGVVAMGRSDTSSGIYGGDDSSLVTFGIGENQWEWLSDRFDNNWYTKYVRLTTNSASYNYLEFRHDYDGHGFKGDAQSESRLVSGYMKRRQMSMPQLRIHTADDDFIQKEEATKALHEAIKPVVALVAGQGGTTKDGTKLYNNSTLTVTRGVSASSYDFADQDNGANKNQSLFYSGEDENRRFELSTSTVNKDGGRITLLRDAESIQRGEDTYINVVMQRTQKYALEISPSVPKSDGTNIDASKIGETWDNFWDKVYANNPDGITYTYREVDWDFTNDGDGFTDPKSVTLNKQNGNTTAWTNSDSTKYTYSTALKNVMSINFHLDPEDRIVLAGTAYAGDEDIPLPANVLLDDTVTFYYYDKEYVTGINTMLASISRVQRFIDLEPTNSPTYGTILGTVDPVTGQFVYDIDKEVPYVIGADDNSAATFYELESLTDESYSITQLSPHGTNDRITNDKHQIVLKVFYTMLPRSLVLPEGANIDEDKAEVVPALVTSVTEPSVRAKMTEEQLAYRYINHFGTGDDKLMYTAAASAPSYVDIPLGGDYGYKYAGADENGYSKVEWTPDWRGNPYQKTGGLTAISFEDPDPIYIDGTLLGDRYPVGEVFDTDGEAANGETGTPGKLTDQGIATVNNYLFSIQASDTFSLCVREDVDDGTSTYAGATNEIDGIESSTLSVTSTSASHKSFGEIEDPSIGYADGKNKKNAVMDSSKANSSFPEYDMLGDITLPAMDLGISDFVSVGIDGQEMSLSIGMGIVSGGWESNFKDQTNHKLQSFEGQDPVDANREAVGKIKRFINTVKGDNTLPGTKKTMGESYREYNKEVYDARRSRPLKPGSTTERQGTVASKGIGLSLGVEIGIVLKWDPIENRFFFNQAYLMAAVSAEFAYTVRFTPVPFLFLCVKFSIGIEFAVALEASRVKVIGTDTDFKGDPVGTEKFPDVNSEENGNENTFYVTSDGWGYYKNQEHMGHDKLEEPEGNDFMAGGVGETFMYTTKEKAIDIYFCGTLYVEIFSNGDPIFDDFEPGVIQSSGDEPVTVKAVQSVDGNELPVSCTYKFTVVANDGVRYHNDATGAYAPFAEGVTIVDRIVSIQRQTHDVYFGGFSISPELFFEVSVGFDALLFTFELFLNISVGCSFAIGVHDSADYAGQKADDYDFKFNEFSAAFTLGFRVSALLVINYEFTGIQFMITYDRETKYDEDTNKKTGWNFIWYGANQPFHQYSLLPEETNPLEPTIVLDSMTDRQEVIYTPEDNAAGEGTFAFDAPGVPFQYSGYGTSGEAFSLGSGIVPGSTYELVTAGGKNYLVYMISDDDADVDINKPRLAISLIQETVQDGVDTMGLVNPADPTGKGNPYLILDTAPSTDSTNQEVVDAYGDIDFDAWVVKNADGTEDIHVAWVTYTAGSESAFINTIVDEDGNITAATSAETMRLLGPFTEVRTVKLDVTVTNTTDEEGNVTSSTTTVTKGTVETVSPAFDAANPHGMYYMPQGAGDMVFYAEAAYYETDELEEILANYEQNYYKTSDTAYSTTTDTKLHYGTNDPTVLYQLAMKRTRLEAYGKSFYPNFAVRTGDNAYAITRVQSTEWMNDGVVLDNAALTEIDTEIGKVYYAAYSTSDIDLVDTDTSAGAENWDERTIKKLYLQKLEVSTTSTTDATTGATTTTTTVTPSKATALRKLVGYANSEDEDGVYTNNALADKYNDPYFANIQFLTGKLGNLDTTEEYNNEFGFDDQLQMTTFADTPETFLLFDMNGNTYVVPENSLATMTVEKTADTTPSGKIIPFFTQAYAYAATEKDDITYEATAYRQDEPVATNVTIGTDGSGNIVAVYTRSENGVPGNAVYMTKYDPNYNSYSDNKASPWGAGTRLAMLNMDVVEEGETYNWSANKTSEHYFDTNEDGILDANDQPKSFQFNRLRIGLAGKDKLLVVTEGSLSQLTAVQRMQPKLETITNVSETDPDYGNTNVVGLEPVMEEYVDASGSTKTRPVYDFNLAKKDGTYNITKGLYALSFGMGQQSLSSAAIHLNDYDMTPGSEMGVSVSFVNNGDVAIRGSERQPIEINLMLEDVGATGADQEPLITWEVTENIRAGQRVSTTLENIILPENISNGDRIYFTVTEDGEYVGSTGGNAFSATTLIDRSDAEGNLNPDTPACITVAAKPELYFDECSIEMVGTETISGEEHVILAPTIKVSNNGNANSDITYLHFQVEKAQENADGLTYVELYDLPLTGHKLTVSDEEAFTTFGGNGYTEANGYLQLRTMQDGEAVEDATKAGQIRPEYSRTVTGTFSVPKDYYDTHFGTGSLNLRVSIVSLNTNKEVNDEYDMANNERSISVEPDTLYTTVNSIQMQKGSTMRLPLSMVTSTTTKPTITVTELTDNGSQNLSVLYYDANQGSLVVMAATGGTDDKPVEGKIRIADTSTNAIHDICYQIRGEGTAINIYNDNGIFTWYDSHNQGGQSGMNAWKFENALFWVQNDPATVPLNTDLAVATAGEYFTFQTFANKLDLYFFGADTNTPVTIEVTSNLGAFGTKTYTSQDYKTPVTIDFGGDSSVAHTVTVKAVSSEVRFDRMCEYFGDDLNVSTDPTAPSIYWSRNPLPAPGSVKQGEKEPLTVTFADLGQLASVSLNGEDITNAVTKDGDGLWMYDMDITENGSYRFVVTDTGGNVTTRDLNVDWFTNTEPAQQDSGAPDITATLVDENDEPAPDFIPAGMDVYLAVTDEEGKLTEAELGRFVEVTQDEQKSQSFETIQSTLDPDHGYPVSTGGIYRVAVKDNGITSYRFVNLDGFDPNIPEVEIGFDKDSMVLTVTVSKQATLSGASPITSVMLNDAEELLAKGETTTYKQFQIPVVYGGTYKVTVRDQAGNVKTSDSIVITPPAIQIPADAITITKVEETEVVDKYGNVTYTSDKNGAVVIDETKITGGSYDPATSGTAGQLKPKYEYALVPAGTVPTNGDWQASPGFSKLDAGTYALYIRDVNHPDQVTGPILITVAFLRVVLQDVLVTQATKESGKDGSITVVATGGDGPLEYAIYEKHLIEDGTLILYNNGTTDTDNDDQLVYKQPDGTEVIRPLWQASPTRGDLTPGTYTVIVRDTTDPARFVEAEVTVPMEEDYAYLTDFFGDMWQIINQEYEITATAGEGGSISHEGVRKVKYSLTVQYSITPADGYRVVSVLVDGEDVGPVATYTFRSVKEDHTIEAIFEKEKDE